MTAPLRHLPKTLGLTALLLAVGCSDGPTTAPSYPVAITLSIVSGNTQSGVVGRELPSPLVVKATNPNGSAIANLTVDFKVTSGGGSMYVVATATNNNGKAQNYWTLGTSTAEPQTVEVRTVLSNGTKQVLGTFTATPLAGPATLIVGVAGDGQQMFRGTAAPVSPAILAKDQYGNLVPYLSVTFAVASGGGSVTGASPLTNSAGIATVGSWTVGPTFGQNTLTATAVGSGILGNPVTFAATAFDWITRAPMPTPRAEVGVGVVNGVLYAVGGVSVTSNFQMFGTVEAYDPVTNGWTTKALMPTPRYGFGVGVVNGVLYALGGWGNQGRLSSVEAYDPATDSWTTRASMPTARAEFGVGVVNGVLYALGGQVQSGYSTGLVEAYDPATDSWTTRASMPTARAYLSVGVANGVLYAVGGATNATLSSVEAYDPATDSWTTKAPKPTPQAFFGVGVVNGVLYAMGAGDDGVSETVEAYDPVTDSWTTNGPAPTFRYAFGVGVVNGVLHAVGGWGLSQQSLGIVEALIP
jgi:N-acetylneuraminic acid mutarotase